MSQSGHFLIAISCATAFSSVFYLSTKLAEKSKRIEREQISRAFRMPPTVEDTRPKIAFTNDTRVRLTPVERGSVIGMADDGTLLGFSGVDPEKFEWDDDKKKLKIYNYFVRYPDGARKALSYSQNAELTMAANGTLIVDEEPTNVTKTLSLITKEGERKLNPPEGCLFGQQIVAPSGDHFQITRGKPYWFDVKKQEAFPSDDVGVGSMNSTGRIVILSRDSCAFGTLENLTRLSVPKVQQTSSYVQISIGTNPKMLVGFVDPDTRLFSFFEVRNSTFAEIQMPEDSEYTRSLAISQDGDILLTDNTDALFLRYNGKWTNLTETQGISIAQYGVPHIPGQYKGRTVFENGSTFINGRKDRQNWIMKMVIEE